MKRESFERLKQSLEQALAYEQGKAKAGRITMRERPVKKVRINIMLDEDIILHFKKRAHRPNSAPYQTQINQALREAMKNSEEDLFADPGLEKLVDMIAIQVAKRIGGSRKKAA
jgi:uncharacterized protein (DUF4415 family)